MTWKSNRILMNREFLYPDQISTVCNIRIRPIWWAFSGLCVDHDGATVATRKKAQQWESERKFPKNPKNRHYHSQTEHGLTHLEQRARRTTGSTLNIFRLVRFLWTNILVQVLIFLIHFNAAGENCPMYLQALVNVSVYWMRILMMLWVWEKTDLSTILSKIRWNLN